MSAFSHCYTSLESLLKAKWRMIRPPAPPTISTHVYKIRPRADKRGVDLISDALRYSPLWYAGPNAVSNAISFAKFNSRPHNAVIRVFDETGTVIETDEKTAPKPAGASEDRAQTCGRERTDFFQGSEEKTPDHTRTTCAALSCDESQMGRKKSGGYGDSPTEFSGADVYARRDLSAVSSALVPVGWKFSALELATI